ncbi:FMN-dependent dehydrogenase-domain-containing protein [Aspergillus avenaceus]|uniref:FMN-dependent dehydrogenase-domain-containing protein n=1 Tax=Aspergillus avenaceus TaxID=36643 RepID=A0A5N6U3F5_ASPAV|nr:FMN-dependent dehydrogenase-domain-containing protein [Aspergillus avenaceus]
MKKTIPAPEIAEHNTPSDMWIVVHGRVYDVTAFAPEHPGGADIINAHAGRDASHIYNSVHPPSLLSELNAHYLGDLDPATIPAEWTQPAQATSQTSTALEDILNLDDFERAAEHALTPKAWAYVNGAANDNVTRDANRRYFADIWFRPAIMRNVKTVSTRTSLFGCTLDIPVYITPVGAARLVHEEGELVWARAAAASGIVHCISTASSYPLGEILDATPKRAFYQLYINVTRSKTEALVRQAEGSGKVSALVVTADLPVMSKREADERTTFTGNEKAFPQASPGKRSTGVARSNSAFIDSTLNWDDLHWLRGITALPLVLKGVQRAEDARKAAALGFDGIIISNHGGRAADTAAPSILVLREIHKYAPEVFRHTKVLIDGGFRRGSDVVKAVCLGVAAVGIGRPFTYALQYGQDGVEHAVDVLRDEIQTAMQLIGMTDLMRDADPRYLNLAMIDSLLPPDYDSMGGGLKVKL